MISKILKYVGILIIVGFSAVSTLFYSIEKETTYLEKQDNFLLTYASFFEDRFFDLRMKLNLKEDKVDKRIVLLEFNDDSLKQIGRWPWPRKVWIEVMRKLRLYGAKVVAYDVFFSEPEVSCDETSPDLMLAQAFADFQSVPGNKVIIPYSMNVYGIPQDSDYKEMPEDLYNFIMDSQSQEGINLEEHFVSRDVYPVKELLAADVALGHIQALGDADGVFRHYYMVSNAETLYLPSFALQAYEYFTGDKTKLIINSAVGQAKLETKQGVFPINRSGTTKIHWLGGRTNFPSVEIHKLIDANDNDPKYKEVFNNTIVFIASTAYGAHDLRHTPVNTQLPGIYSHMNATHMLLEGDSFKPQELSTKYSWMILILATVVIILVQLLNNPILDIAAVIAVITGLFFLDLKYFIPQGYEIRLFFCFFSIIGCYSWTTFLNFYLAGKDKQFLKNAFGTYISPELIDEMYSSGQQPSLGGESGIRTAYFTDIQSFSTFSEKLTATQLVELLNEYLTAMTDILLEEGGTLDKYEGDAIIAFFGAPMPLEDHAARACMTAHRMQEKLLELREKWTAEGDKWPKIVHEMRMRIGMNTGEMVTGNMGSTQRMNYTMMGDSVNLAARLEESAKQYGIFTQVSEETHDDAGGEFLWRELDTIKVVGKSVPVKTFELLGIKDEAPDYLEKLSKKFKVGISLYKEQKFDEAIKVFKETLEFEYKRFPELKGVKTNPSEVYIDRCEQFKKFPPTPDWDGVWTLTSK